MNQIRNTPKNTIAATSLALIAASALASCLTGGIAIGQGSSCPVIVTLSTAGVQANGESEESYPNRTGSMIAFRSTASNLSPIDNTAVYQKIFIRNRTAGRTDLVSVGFGNVPADGSSYKPSVDNTGDVIAFASDATNLVPGDSNGVGDIFVRDMTRGTTTRVSVPDGGGEADGPSGTPSISGNGARIAFRSNATNLVPTPSSTYSDIYVRDSVAGTTRRVSVASDNSPSNGYSPFSVISRDGRFVVFVSYGSNLVPGNGDGNNAADIFVRDLDGGTTERVSVTGVNGELPQGASAYGVSPPFSVSADGRFVAFMSEDNTVVPNDNNGTTDVFVRDRIAHTTEIVSVSSSGEIGDGISEFPSISDDGRFVVFRSYATNFSPGIPNPVGDIFVHDRTSGTTRRVGLGPAGVVADRCPGKARVSGDGSIVTFPSAATNLAPGDVNNVTDIFIVPL